MSKTFSLDGRPFIELKNLVKFMNYVNSGGEAKVFIQNGDIIVNGEVEVRRGRKLVIGDKIIIQQDEIEII